MKRSRRWTWALAASITAHVIALVALRREPDPPKKQPLTPVQLSFLKVEKPIEVAPPRPTVRAEKKRIVKIVKAEEPPAPPPTEAPVESGRPSAEKPSGGPLKLPSFLGGGSTSGSETKSLDEGTPTPAAPKSAQETLDGLIAEHARTTNAKKKGLDARSQQIARGIQNAFQANVSAVQRSQEHLKPVAGNKVGDTLGKVVGQVVRDLKDGVDQWQREIDARDHRDPNAPKAGEIGLSAAGVDIPDATLQTANPRKARSDVGLFCFGACGSTASHEKLRLTTRIAIDHDERGVPIRWAIERSSGETFFDADALQSVQLALGCMRGGGHHVLFCRGLDQPAFGPVPRRSTWLLHGIVRRWSHTERLLDPQFKPSGKKIGEGMFAGDYLESAVEIVELAYWDAGSQPTSVPN